MIFPCCGKHKNPAGLDGMEHAFSSSRERKTTIAKAKGLVADAGPLFAELSVEEVAS